MSERELRFRAWNISGEQWEYFTLEELACGGVYNHPIGMPTVCKWDNYKWWCQYTGIKNGKVCVYTDDICKARRHGYEHIGKVVFWNGCFTLTDKTSVGGLRPLCQYDLEVIGCIHENPKLLEKP